MAITPRTNPNFEKVGSIKIVSAGKPTDDEQRGFIFGGLGYTASIDVNDGNGYTITINVVSKDGEYSISEKDLNATSAGAKNIQIGNFIFFDFFLVSYSIQKQVENSILVLTYKDKSIFMDKLYIGLLHHEHGISLYKEEGITRISQPTSITNYVQTIKFDYRCDKSNNRITQIPLARDLYTIFTARNNSEFKDFTTDQKNSILNLVNSPYFYSKYDYAKNGVNGGFLILGSEEFKESPCAIRDTSYTFRDLLSALFYSKIPGIKEISLPKNDIFKFLRKNYFGSLRNVLSNWSSDIGIRFYYQPKIQYKTRDYNNLNSSPSDYLTIQEGLKYLDPNSGPESLKRLNTFLKSNDGKILKKVIQNINESASLEGTVKSSVITSIRREARIFPKSIENVDIRSSTPLGRNNIPAFYEVNPNTNTFLIRATLGKYDEELRDIYALNNFTDDQNIKAMGIVGSPIDLFVNKYITNNLDFLALFGEELGTDISGTLNNYKAYIVRYDTAKHEAIKNWERAVMDEFYNQYYPINFNTEQKQFCGSTSNFNIQFDTEPPSQRYSANELPFKNLLYNKSELTLLNSTFNSFKTNPLFQVNNPFDDRNESVFNSFVSSFASNTYTSKKSLKIIDLYSNASARSALLMCVDPKYFPTVFSNLDKPNTYLIVCPSLTYGDFQFNVSLFENVTNLSILAADKVKNDNVGQKNSCDKTICEQSIDDIGCRSSNNSQSVYTGFIGVSGNPIGNAKAIRLNKNSNNYDLILPTDCPYRYAITRQITSTTTFPAQNYVLGSPPEFPSSSKTDTGEYNVLNYSCVRNPVPEILTQVESEFGVQDKIITFNDDKAPGERAFVTDALTFHTIASKQINNSIAEPFQTKTFSLTSTYIPTQLQSYLFDNPILSSMNFQLGSDGFNMSFTFQSRPKEPKPLDSVFQTQQFLEIL